jgi:ubiquinone/menaquinone biosynthesis C-methylase UbiE
MKLNWIERIIVNSPFRLFMQSAEVKWLAGKLPLSPGGTILEIGCGRGVGAALVNQKFNPSRIYLTDLDLSMVRKAGSYLAEKNRSKFQFCLSDATYLPFGNQKFDAVFGFGFLHHVHHWRESLAEVARILKTGGAYYLEEFYPQLYQNVITKHLLIHPEFDRFKSRDLKDCLQDLNLELMHTLEIKSMGIIGVGIKG